MNLSEEEFEILYIILMSPGININQLYRNLKNKISKVKLLRLLRELRSIGLIYNTRDPRHKQRIRLFLEKDIQDFAKKILIKTYTLTIEDTIEEIDKLIKKYIEISLIIKDPLTHDFLKKLVLKEIDEILYNITRCDHAEDRRTS